MLRIKPRLPGTQPTNEAYRESVSWVQSFLEGANVFKHFERRGPPTGRTSSRRWPLGREDALEGNSLPMKEAWWRQNTPQLKTNLVHGKQREPLVQRRAERCRRGRSPWRHLKETRSKRVRRALLDGRNLPVGRRSRATAGADIR